MIKVAITGNIGSGKSIAVTIFSVLGIPVFHADHEAKLLYKDYHVRETVRRNFGNYVFNQQDEVDFKQLAKEVFNNPESLKLINTIIHPLVFEKYNNWLKLQSDHKYTIHEAAIIFENQLEHHYDLIIHVSAPEENRMQRVMKRDAITQEQFLERARNQWTDAKKNKKADLTILNDGHQFLIPQIMKIHNHIMQL